MKRFALIVILNFIECAGINGRNRRVIRSDVQYPFGLTLYGERLFWTDWQE